MRTDLLTEHTLESELTLDGCRELEPDEVVLGDVHHASVTTTGNGDGGDRILQGRNDHPEPVGDGDEALFLVKTTGGA